MKKISVILINDNQLIPKGVTDKIEQQPDINLITTFGNSKKALAKVCDLKPNVLLLDLSITNKNNLVFMQSIMKKCQKTKVIVLDVVPIQKDILQYIEAGVSGFILKDATSENFLKTIRSVAEEEKILPSNLTASLFSQIVENEVNQSGTTKMVKTLSMTKQEREIVLLIADGLTIKEIAQKLYLSASIVKSHVHNILEKMVLNTQIQSAIYASPSEDINTADGSTLSNDE